MKSVYQIIAAYFEDDCADELSTEPVMVAALEKDALASRSTETIWADDPHANRHSHNSGNRAIYVIQLYCGRGRMENFIKEGKWI